LIKTNNDAPSEMAGTPYQTATEAAAGIEIFPILMCAHGDSPWSAKLACVCGHAAENGCHRCGLQSAKQAPNGDKLSSSAYSGAHAPAPCRTFDRTGFKYTKICYLCRPIEDTGTDEDNIVFNKKEAALIRVDDRKYDMRANSAEEISQEEYRRWEEQIKDREAQGQQPASEEARRKGN
jgi:hypothetical protein